MSVIGNNPSCSTNNPPWVCTGNPDDTSVGEAWAALLQTAKSGGAKYRLSDTFGYDLVMVTAQALNMVIFDAQNRTVSAYHARNLSAIKAQRAVLLGALRGLDDLMGTRTKFLLGNWLAPARAWAKSTAPYTATCDAGVNTKRTACTRPFVGAARVCDGAKGSLNKVSTNCTASANCATCVDGSFGTVNESPCLSCKRGFAFFDWGTHGCTGSCNSDTQTHIPVDLCEFRGCCFNDSAPKVASCFERPRSAEAAFVVDAKTVITLLGTSGSASQEYADRIWQGMLSGYYLPRWSQWFDFVETTLVANKTYDEAPFTAALRVWQENWILSDTRYRTEPRGNAVDISAALFTKYSHLLRGGTPGGRMELNTPFKADDLEGSALRPSMSCPASRRQPAGSPASGGARNTVLTYMDYRSELGFDGHAPCNCPGVHYPTMVWNASNFTNFLVHEERPFFDSINGTHFPAAAKVIMESGGVRHKTDDQHDDHQVSGRYSEAELDALATKAKEDGAVLLKGLLDPAKLKLIRAAFRPVLAARIARAGPDRGPGRYYGALIRSLSYVLSTLYRDPLSLPPSLHLTSVPPLSSDPAFRPAFLRPGHLPTPGHPRHRDPPCRPGPGPLPVVSLNNSTRLHRCR